MKSNLKEALLKIPSYDLNDYTVVVFGASNTSALYQKCFEHEGIRPVFYVDNDKAKQDTVFYGVSVISLEKLIALRQTFSKPLLVLISSAQISACQIQKQLREHGLNFAIPDAFVFKKNMEMIEAVYDLLEDDFSRDVYAHVILSRINNNPMPESMISGNQYFLAPHFLELSANEVFVDAGAYVGDTMEQYIYKKSGVFGKIYAFEPNARNFSALKHRTERLKNEWAFSDDKLILVHGGVGAKTESIFTSAIGEQSSANPSVHLVVDKTKGINETMVYALDDYFKEQRISFIKADIENYELDMLRGAKSIIKRDKPLLAVCIYHNAVDMFTIPLFVKELCKDYKLKIRHHSYNLSETVLYADACYV